MNPRTLIVVREVLIVACFCGAAIYFVSIGARELASAALATASTLVVPRNTVHPVAVGGAVALFSLAAL